MAKALKAGDFIPPLARYYLLMKRTVLVFLIHMLCLLQRFLRLCLHHHDDACLVITILVAVKCQPPSFFCFFQTIIFLYLLHYAFKKKQKNQKP